ncbi:Uncharacterised protein [Mycobacteroides abscessus]|nr:Uncharacterised protein [Mycobacteroides abscessus]
MNHAATATPATSAMPVSMVPTTTRHDGSQRRTPLTCERG